MSKKRKHNNFNKQGGNAASAVYQNKPIEESPQEERKTNIILDEISVLGSKLYSMKGVPDYNPDSLVGKKGLQIYSQMREDDQIKAVLTMKKMAMLSTNWDIYAASDDPLDIEKRDFIKWNLDNLEGTIEDYLWNIFTAYDFGFSISEKNWYRIQKGRWAGKIGLKSIKTREPFYYSFESDEYGNLRDDGIVFIGGTLKLPKSVEELGISNSRAGTHLPKNKFIIYSYQKEFQNHYGKSDLRSAYRSYWAKEVLIRFFNIYMERFGMPTHVGTFPRGTSKADRDDLRTVLDRVQSKYSIVIPEDVKIDLLRADSGGADGYARAIELHNKFIARSILVPDLMGYTEMASGGAYALGKKHFDMFLWIIKKGHKDTEETIIGEQVIKPLIDMNWNDTEDYPYLKFESVTEEGSQAKAAMITQGIQSSFISPKEPWIRDYLGLPSKPDDIELPAIQTPSPVGVIPTEIEGRLQGLEEKVQEFKEFREGLRRKFHIGEYGEPKKTIVHFQDKKEKEIKVEPSQFTKKMDYVEVKQSLDDYQDETVDALSEIVTEMRDDLVRRVRRKKLIENQDLVAINKLQVKYVGDFKRELEKRALKLYVDGKLEAAKMLKKGGIDIEIVTKFQSVGDWKPVPPVDAMDFFKKKILVKVKNKEGQKVMINLLTGDVLDYYTQKAFYIAGIEKEEILKQAKASLLNSLKEGHSVDHAVANLGNVFDKYIERGELDDEGELISAHRLETIVRTNFSEAYNRGLRDFIDDKDITDFVPYLQWSAILDSRVRETHAQMDGKIFREDDPDIEGIPPGGYNCYDKETEVYTKEGWRFFEDIVGNEEFLSLNPKTLEIEWVKGKKKIIYPYKGKMVNIKAANFDLMVTPDHQLLVQKSWDRHEHRLKMKFINANSIADSDRFLRTGKWNVKGWDAIRLNNLEIESEVFAKFMGYWLSEGSISVNPKGKYVIKIAQSNQINKNIIANELRDFPLKLWIGKEAIYIKPTDDLAQYLRQFGKSYMKFVPQEIKGMSIENIKKFLDAYLLGDGKKGKIIKSGFGYQTKYLDCYFTSSKMMADDLGELILKTGKFPSFAFQNLKGKLATFKNGTYKLNTDIWRIYECQKGWFNFSKRKHYNEVDYNDNVYCIELKRNHVLWIRRNRKTVWCGNCRCVWIPLTSVEVEDEVAAGRGIKVSTREDFPPDFPDPGFKSFSEKNKGALPGAVEGQADRVYSYKGDVSSDGTVDHKSIKNFIRFDPNSTLNEGRFRLMDPQDFKSDSIRSWNEWAGIKAEGIRFIVGDLKDGGDKSAQAIRFDKDKWTEEKATEWWNAHKDKFKKTWTQADWDKKYEEFLRVEEMTGVIV